MKPIPDVVGGGPALGAGRPADAESVRGPAPGGDVISPEWFACDLEMVRRVNEGFPPEDHLSGCLCSDACLEFAMVWARRGRRAEQERRELVRRGRWLAQRAETDGVTDVPRLDVGAALDRIAERTEVCDAGDD